ncbi:DUF4259 domain-containing protein [bacterium]|nr:DUF4259 domain-containing protein [bacterium]
MGTWGEKSFDNDDACDWVFELQETDDLSAVELAFAEVEAVGNENLEPGIACNAIAACEVIARLQGNHGYQDAYTEEVDKWVASHPIKPSNELIQRAKKSLDRILADNSELKYLWEDAGAKTWLDAIDDLRKRL